MRIPIRMISERSLVVMWSDLNENLIITTFCFFNQSNATLSKQSLNCYYCIKAPHNADKREQSQQRHSKLSTICILNLSDLKSHRHCPKHVMNIQDNNARILETDVQTRKRKTGTCNMACIQGQIVGISLRSLVRSSSG